MISLADDQSAGRKSRGVNVTPLPRCHVNVAVAWELSWKCWLSANFADMGCLCRQHTNKVLA